MLDSLSWQLLLAVLFLVAFGFFLGFWLARKGQRRLLADNSELATELESVQVSADQLEVALDNIELLQRSKNQFYYSASHDLKQPLHALEMFSSVLQKQELNETSRNISRDISEVVKDISRETSVLLDIARVDVEVLKLYPVEIDLGAETRRIANQFRRYAKEKSLLLRVNTSDNQIILLDRVLFDRIQRNLLDNAIKFTDAGYVEVTADYNSDNAVVLTVVDSGLGISKEDQEGIYREFYQGKKLPESYLSGVGLGLSSVLKMIQRLNGTIDIDSPSGHGTSVVVTIPEVLAGVKVADDSISVNTDTPINANLGTILFYQSNNLVGRSTAMLIASAGYNMLVTDSLSEAYALQKSNKISSACFEFTEATDMARTFLETLRLRNPGMPIVVMASDIKTDTLFADLSVTVLQKPVDAEQLLEAIRPGNSR